MQKEVALEIKNVSKTLSEKRVLHKINLAIPRGTTHILLGPSGSGKSTLIRIIIGLLAPNEGSLILNGLTQEKCSHRGEWNRQIGYVPQEGGLFPHLTARQNVSLVAETIGWSKAKIKARLEELKPVTNLDEALLDRYPKELSGGQRQRVALLRATFLDPALLILDEPLGALDPIIRAEVQNELKTIFRALNKTVIMVTHDIDEARFFGDSLTLIRDGQVLQTGTFLDFVSNPSDPFVTRFIRAQRNEESPA